MATRAGLVSAVLALALPLWGGCGGSDVNVGVGTDTEVSVLSDRMRKVRVALVMKDNALVDVITRIDLIDHVARVTASHGGV